MKIYLAGANGKTSIQKALLGWDEYLFSGRRIKALDSYANLHGGGGNWKSKTTMEESTTKPREEHDESDHGRDSKIRGSYP